LRYPILILYQAASEIDIKYAAAKAVVYKYRKAKKLSKKSIYNKNNR
jgi:hypothetical protein